MENICSGCKCWPKEKGNPKTIRTDRRSLCEAGYPHPSTSVEAYLNRIKPGGYPPCFNDPLRPQVFSRIGGAS
jgi:hypothetical protein